MKRLILVVSFILLLAGCGLWGGTSRPSEGPEDVVKRFYAYIHEGGSTTLSEAYRLISTKRYKLPEERFKVIVASYPKDMKVDIIGSSIQKDRAIVTIEYRTASAFGGDYVGRNQVNLELDKASHSWKIDFTGETYSDEVSQRSPDK
ncbi:MAG: hypothetical protein HY878_01170 [Deltaproteobacteria bacterium]|nr:hypothetical protein [Deltaproteobacteria bacterium]